MFIHLSVFLTFSLFPSSLSNMHIDTTVDAAIQTADLVVEAVVENMELKQKLFAEYDDKVITDHLSNKLTCLPVAV